MAHPLKADSESAHSSKLHRMTRHYGAAGPNNIKSPQEYLKGNGGEQHVGYGADSEMASARSDRPARRSAAANPLPTYARGGKVKGATNVNIIVAPQSPQQPGPGAGPSPQLAALAQKAMGAPPPGAMPPLGAPPMMSPGAGPGGPPMMPRARGGKVKHSDEAEDKKLFHKMMAEHEQREAKMERAASKGRATGGRVPDLSSMDAGSMSGEGRLEKIKIQKRNLPKAQEV